MNRAIVKKAILTLLILCMSWALCACSQVGSIRLPPLPTPFSGEAIPTADVFAPIRPDEAQPNPAADMTNPNPAADTPNPIPEDNPAPFQNQAPAEPVSTPITTPSPEPTPIPTPVIDDVNIPHLFIEGETYPENMGQYGVVELLGNIYTDKGVIAMVWGRLLDEDGNIVQNCKYYPYTDSFSLAGTVNAELRFGLLEPGHYAYVVSAIAENNSYSSGEIVLIEHPFEIFYP